MIRSSSSASRPDPAAPGIDRHDSNFVAGSPSHQPVLLHLNFLEGRTGLTQRGGTKKTAIGTIDATSRKPKEALTSVSSAPRRTRLTIRELLKPHSLSLGLGFIAVLGESLANLLQPWPLKIVLDEVFKGHAGKTGFPAFVYAFLGTDKFAAVKFACIAVLAIALLDAVSTYTEKYLTTSVGQWVTYDLRRALYAHMQRLSIAFHDQKRTGDLISRVTS